MVHAPEWQSHVSIATLAMCDYSTDPNQLPDSGEDQEQPEHQSERQPEPPAARNLGMAPPPNPTREDEDSDDHHHEHNDEHHNEHEPWGGDHGGNANNNRTIDPADLLDHNSDRVQLPGTHSMELDGGGVNPLGNQAGSAPARVLPCEYLFDTGARISGLTSIAEPNGYSTSGAGHRRGADPGVGPWRGSPASPRPSPLPSRSITPTGQPSAKTGKKAKRPLVRTTATESVGGGSSSGFNTPIASQSLELTFGNEHYNPNTSETAAATINWQGKSFLTLTTRLLIAHLDDD